MQKKKKKSNTSYLDQLSMRLCGGIESTSWLQWGVSELLRGAATACMNVAFVWWPQSALLLITHVINKKQMRSGKWGGPHGIYTSPGVCVFLFFPCFPSASWIIFLCTPLFPFYNSAFPAAATRQEWRYISTGIPSECGVTITTIVFFSILYFLKQYAFNVGNNGRSSRIPARAFTVRLK